MTEIFKLSRRIDAAILVLKGGKICWDRNDLPFEIVRTEKGTFKKQEIPTIFPSWMKKLK